MSYNMTDLIAMQSGLEEHIESELVPSGVRIHQLVDASFKAVGISKVSHRFVTQAEFRVAMPPGNFFKVFL